MIKQTIAILLLATSFASARDSFGKVTYLGDITDLSSKVECDFDHRIAENLMRIRHKGQTYYLTPTESRGCLDHNSIQYALDEQGVDLSGYNGLYTETTAINVRSQNLDREIRRTTDPQRLRTIEIWATKGWDPENQIYHRLESSARQARYKRLTMECETASPERKAEIIHYSRAGNHGDNYVTLGFQAFNYHLIIYS